MTKPNNPGLFGDVCAAPTTFKPIKCFKLSNLHNQTIRHKHKRTSSSTTYSHTFDPPMLCFTACVDGAPAAAKGPTLTWINEHFL